MKKNLSHPSSSARFTGRSMAFSQHSPVLWAAFIVLCAGLLILEGDLRGIARRPRCSMVKVYPRTGKAIKAGSTFQMVSARRLAALALIESGDNDHARGAAGEVSRYQIKPSEWRRVCALEPGRAAVNPVTARNVAVAILQVRCSAFATRFHRAPDDFEFYVLWNAPGELPKASVVVRERARRFANLCQTRERI